MKTRILALMAVLTLVLPGSAYALETNELVAIAAMPLAVAAVANLPDVPTTDLVSVVSAMNRASVPPPQFIEVVRYVPVALVDRREPTFVSYVTTQVDNGLVGDALAVSLADRMIDTYGLNEINVVNPQTVYVVERREFVPTVVATRLEPAPFDALSVVAMPLAVAAVANLTDVPVNDLISFISALNQAAVPAPQFVEVVRYSPVMFIEPTVEPQFVNFVSTEVGRGVRGNRLAIVIADRYRTIGLRDVDINVVHPPRTVYVDRTQFVPPMVRIHVAEVRAHPHGGPPGQLKKEHGVQTGAQIVHERHPGKGVIVRTDVDNGRQAQQPRVVQQEPRPQVTPRSHGRSEGSGKGKKVAASAPTLPRDHGKQQAVRTASNDDGRGHGDKGSKGNSKGKGKGKGNS
jgi:hypothetical protein